MRYHRRRTWLAALVIVIAGVALLSGQAQATSDGDEGSSAEHNRHRNNHCVADGVDLNELYGTSALIVNRFCPSSEAGQRWTTGAPWLMGSSFESVPEGYVPAGATPTEDFVARFVSARIVVDAGTSTERTYVFPKSAKLWTGEWPAGDFEGFPTVSTVPLTVVKPLSVGEHTFELYWNMNGVHCDGLGANPEENCLPDGEFLWGLRTFEVHPEN